MGDLVPEHEAHGAPPVDGRLERRAELRERPSTYIYAAECLHACGAPAAACARVLGNVLEVKLAEARLRNVLADRDYKRAAVVLQVANDSKELADRAAQCARDAQVSATRMVRKAEEAKVDAAKVLQRVEQ